MLRRRGQGEPGTARRLDGRSGVGRGVAGEGGGRVVRWRAVLGSAEEGRESEREEDDKLREALGGVKAFEGREKRAAKEEEEQGR